MAYRSIARALDTLDLAFCLFDANDLSILWNQTFLRFFPEHRGHIFSGEHYGENLRRFYRARLSAVELPFLERYVADGIARNRNQTRPFHFEHNGRWLRVTSVPEPTGGRIRIWTQISRTGSKVGAAARTEQLSLAVSTPERLSFLETVGEAATFMDAQARIVHMNPQFLELYGISDGQTVVNKTYPELIRMVWSHGSLDDERAEHKQDISAALLDGINFSGTPFEVPLPGQRWVRVTMSWPQDGQCYALHWDVTESKDHETELRNAEHRARESERQLRAVTNDLRIETHRLERTEARVRTTFISSGIPTLVVRGDGVLIDANDAAGAMLQYDIDDLLGLRLADVVESKASDIVIALLKEGSEPELVSGVEVSFLRRDGCAGICQLFGAKAAISGTVPHAVLHMLDITSRKLAELEKEANLKQLQIEALNDPLTGLGNRRYLEHALRDRMLDGHVHSLLFVDLDGFKAVNDRAGHSAGDALLKRIADVLVASVRASDFVGRLGGDEFLVVLRSCDEAGARIVASTIISSIATASAEAAAERTSGNGDQCVAVGAGAGISAGIGVSIGASIGASIGVRIFSGLKDSVDTLIDDADSACYTAKRNGKNRAEVFHRKSEVADT